MEVKLRIMLRNWSYSEFKEILYKEAKEGKDHINTNTYKRIYAYLRTLELRKQNLSYNKIRRIINSEIGYTPPKSELSYWLRGLCTPLTKITVFDVHQPEVGLLLGLILSDGCEYQRYCYNHLYGARERFFNRNEAIIREFKEACSKLGLTVYGSLDPPKLGRQCWRFGINSTLLYLLLKRYDVFIVKAPTNVQRAFLRGLWLGDGHIGYEAIFYNTDLNLIKIVEKLLRAHNIKYFREGPYRPKPKNLPDKPTYKPMYLVCIDIRSWQEFLELTGFAESPLRPFYLLWINKVSFNFISRGRDFHRQGNSPCLF